MAKVGFFTKVSPELREQIRQHKITTGIPEAQQVDQAMRAYLGRSSETAAPPPRVKRVPKAIQPPPLAQSDTRERQPEADVCSVCRHPWRHHRPIKGSSNLRCSFGPCTCRRAASEAPKESGDQP